MTRLLEMFNHTSDRTTSELPKKGEVKSERGPDPVIAETNKRMRLIFENNLDVVIKAKTNTLLNPKKKTKVGV